MDLIHPISFDYGFNYGNVNSEMLNHYPLSIPYLSLFFVEQGDAVLNIDFKEYQLIKGSFVVVGEDNIASFKKQSDDFTMHCFLINREFASEIAYVLPNELFSYLHYFPVQYLDKTDIHIYEVWHTFSIYTMHQTRIHNKRIMCSHLQNLFLTLSERVNYEELVIEKRYSRQEELCWKFWDLISKYAKTHRDVTFYAGELYVTPYYLSQVSQQFLNYSPKELINRQVILEIKYYLQNTDLNISQIADELHFADPSYMGRFFKRETGVNPLEFRRKR